MSTANSLGNSKRGRRRGSEDTRELILTAARGLFAESGFDAVSIRQIARLAGVDPALIHHYFSSKDELFEACVELPANPAEVLAEIGDYPPNQRAEPLLLAVLGLWESPAQAALLALLKSAVNSPGRSALMRQVLGKLMLPRLILGLEEDPELQRLRGSLVVSQVFGLVMTRYVLKLEPLSSAPLPEVVRWAAPTVQRYLTGNLDGGELSGGLPEFVDG
ncbi:AcrR family transcriptional regulator [Psychromicrobium silvestre]|uniref:AcrR family transcriptional regulator n=1 Tax=Psychromicrobium silvestre TaxID=1645614 RepID=A0A7Y9S8R7_9MICC|nr:AcrR family transcriptional regulator [Psychromicrobium silvestre]